MILAFKIALRYLRAKKSNTAVNIIAIIAVVGVAIATMAMMLVLSIFNGFSDLAESQLSSLDPELAIVRADGYIIDDGEAVAATAADVDGVDAALPTLTSRAMLITAGRRIPVVFKGVPSGYDAISAIDRIMIAGEYAEATSDGYGALQVSVGVANQLDIYPGPDSRVNLYVPRRAGRINPANPSAAFRGIELALSGVFSVRNPDIDTDNIIIPLEDARNVLDYDNQATAIEVHTTGGADIDNVKADLADALGSEYKVLGRIEQRESSFRMISIEKWMTFMMLIFILVIALFNVVSTLSLLAIEKRDNMWTLRALGATPSMTRNVFIAEGFLITTFGGIIGIILGLAVALAQQYFHLVGLSADASTLTIDYYPVRVEPFDIIIVALVIILLAIVVASITRLIVSRSNPSNT